MSEFEFGSELEEGGSVEERVTEIEIEPVRERERGADDCNLPRLSIQIFA